MDYGRLSLNINELLEERSISKNKICKDLNLTRGNFNRYCRNEFQRIDAELICKLCYYLKVDVGELIHYNAPNISETDTI